MPSRTQPQQSNPVIVLEEASFGRYGTKPPSATEALPAKERKGDTLLGFGPHAHLTYERVLAHKYKTYVEPTFGRYRYVDKQAQDITMSQIQQSLEFVPTGNTVTNNNLAAQAFASWLQTPEAGHIYEAAKQKQFDKDYAENRPVHDVAALCFCVIQ